MLGLVLALAAAFVLVPAVEAQTGKITGVVTDQSTGEPLEGAQAFLAETGYGALSSTNGRYFILNVPPGTNQVSARRNGYSTVNTTNVQVVIDVTREVNFALPTAAANLGTVTVEAEAQPLIEAGQTGSQIAITAVQIEALPVTSIEGALSLVGTDLLPLPASQAWPDSVVTVLSNVEALAGGVYKVWFVNPVTDQSAPATGTWVRTLGTDTVASGLGELTFDGGPGTIRIVTDAYTDIGQPDVSDSLATLLISIEQSASAASPSTAQPFWTTIIKRAGGTVGGAVVFGEFTLGNDSRGPERFTAQGTMAGGIIGDTVVVLVDTTINGQATRIRAAQFVGSLIEVRFTGLMRPPLGYRYRAYLCSSESGTCNAADPETEFFDLGGLVSPSGVSLDNADVAPNDSNLSSTRIVSSFVSVDVIGVQTLCDFDRFRLVLERIAGGGPPLAHIFDAALPAQLTGARSCR